MRETVCASGGKFLPRKWSFWFYWGRRENQKQRNESGGWCGAQKAGTQTHTQKYEQGGSWLCGVMDHGIIRVGADISLSLQCLSCRWIRRAQYIHSAHSWNASTSKKVQWGWSRLANPTSFNSADGSHGEWIREWIVGWACSQNYTGYGVLCALHRTSLDSCSWYPVRIRTTS